MVLLAEIGVPVKYGHSKVGYIQPDEVDARIWDQHEIDLALQPLRQSFPEVADALREVRATFEAAGVFPAHVIERTLDALGQM